jgi:hypothetical protein
MADGNITIKLSVNLLPDGFRFRTGWFGRVILQKQAIAINPRGVPPKNKYKVWVDATSEDVFSFFMNKEAEDKA